MSAKANIRCQSVSVVSQEIIEGKILLIRGKKVMLDRHLAELYGVETKVLNQAVKRNQERFPKDFMFQLTKDEAKFLRSHFATLEAEYLRSQFVTLDKGRGRYSKYRPYVFTEPGVAMLSSVLNSPRAIQVNIQIIRTFIRLRKLLLTNDKLRRKIEGMEQKYDQQFKVVFEAIKQLLMPPEKPKNKIGFHP